ncbi:MAG TPA: hypothetical protein VL332_10435 [Candidatus Saccharimonadaceae bacterium]|jgi:hypothetical protein|nr:hypothetical protein [Candidatus Saccharimonadaceae bacterium]
MRKRRSWFVAHAPARLAFLIALMGLVASTPARADVEGEAPPMPPSAKTTQLPEGFARTNGGRVVSTARVATTGKAPVVISTWDATHQRLDVPPDPHGAMGPDGFLRSINASLVYYRKNGHLVWEATPLVDLVPQEQLGLGIDPRVLYDPGCGRFFVIFHSYRNEPPYQSFIDVAVSKNSDPASNGAADWFSYRFEVTDSVGSTKYAADLPSIGFDAQGVYITADMFSFPLDGFSEFRDCIVMSLDKAQLISGTASMKLVRTPDISGAFALAPMSVVGDVGPGNVAYFGEIDFSSTTGVRVWALSDPLGTPTLTSADVSVPNHGGAISGAPQSGTSVALDTQSPRTQGNGFWRDGAMWFCHTAGGSAGRAIVYYYKVATNGFPSSAPTLAESGFFDGGPGVWDFMPTIGGNAKGDVCVVFTQSSSSQFPTVMVAARQAGADAFPAPIVVRASDTFYSSTGSFARWGDYATVAVDPADSTFWIGNELAGNSALADQYDVVVGNVVFPDDQPGWVVGGVPVRRASTGIARPRVVPDGANGAIVGWIDGRSPEFATVFLRRVLATGAMAPGWPYDGLEITPASGANASDLSLVSDGAGGAFVVWNWLGSGVRVTRVTGSGAFAPGWTNDGVRVTTSTGANPAAAADGAGGVLVAWSQSGIHAQRVSPAGALAWPSGGVSLSSSGGTPDVASDGAGGAIVSWNSGVHIQRVDATGVPLWAAGGISLATGANAHLVADGSGGAIVAFQALGSGQDLYAVRLDATGAVVAGWTPGGTAVSTAPFDQRDERLVADGAGGAVICWTDFRRDATNSTGDIFAERLTADGAVAPGWSVNGVGVCTASGAQSQATLLADSTGGACIAWSDGRGPAGDIYLERVTSEGSLDPTIPIDGAALCSQVDDQQAPALAMVGRGSLVAAWEDSRTAADCQFSCTGGVFANVFAFDAVVPAASALTPSAGSTSLEIDWIESGDDGATGPAHRFDIRYSTAPITAVNFFTAFSLGSAPPSGTPGSPHCADVAGLPSCTPYYFGLKTYDEAGNPSAFTTVAAATTCAGVDEVSCSGTLAVDPPAGSGEPASLRLLAPRPNPARGACDVDFEVPRSAAGQALDLAVFDLAGRKVATLAHGSATVGRWSERWQMSASGGTPVRAGVFYVRLKVGTFTQTQVMVSAQ